jgi:hypothetical protein
MMKSLLVVVVGIAMLIPSVAFAGSSTCQGYSQKTCPPTSNTTTSPAPGTSTAPNTSAASTGASTASTSPSEATTSSSTGSLPFTGLDVAALMVGASVLLGGGLVMRYLSRDQQK